MHGTYATLDFHIRAAALPIIHADSLFSLYEVQILLLNMQLSYMLGKKCVLEYSMGTAVWIPQTKTSHL